MQKLINYSFKKGIALFRKSDQYKKEIQCDPLTEKKLDEMKRNQKLLKTNLLHLEFISKFESYLENKNSDHFPLEFLLELHDIKKEIQINIHSTSEKLNREYAIAI